MLYYYYRRYLNNEILSIGVFSTQVYKTVPEILSAIYDNNRRRIVVMCTAGSSSTARTSYSLVSQRFDL